MITDKLGNPIVDGDWVNFNVKEMATAQVVAAIDGGLLDSSQRPTPAFINVVIQIPCDAAKRLPGVVKAYGPPRTEGVLSYA